MGCRARSRCAAGTGHRQAQNAAVAHPGKHQPLCGPGIGGHSSSSASISQRGTRIGATAEVAERGRENRIDNRQATRDGAPVTRLTLLLNARPASPAHPGVRTQDGCLLM